MIIFVINHIGLNKITSIKNPSGFPLGFKVNLMGFIIHWKIKSTNVEGHGKSPVSHELGTSWLRYLNEKYKDEIDHWLVEM